MKIYNGKLQRASSFVTVAVVLVLAASSALLAQDAARNAMVTNAVAVLQPAQNSKVKGTVTFTKSADGTRVQAAITGLTPGKHGFHIHEYGDLTAADASSAGGHFNPTGEPHGAPDAPKHHVGDLGNITADGEGSAKYDQVIKGLTLEGGKSILGRAVVVHAKADDLTSQPSGDAGDRVAAGVIGVAKPQQ